jgi:hypothetical protein
MRGTWSTLGFLVLLTGSSALCRAQYRPTSYAAWRGDVIVANGASEHAGAGVEIPLDIYVREGVYAEGGATERDGTVVPSGRVDVLTRFLLDPYRQARWGFSLGGGLTVPLNESRNPTRPYVAIVMDFEGPRTGAVTPAVQLGLGGGARLGLVLRANRRADQR